MKQVKIIFAFAILFIFVGASGSYALTPEEEVRQLKEQVKVLLDRVEKLEADVASTKAAKPEEKAEKKEEPLAAMLAKTGTSLKISGRWAAGYFDSQENGSYPNGSFQAPEAKLRFDFAPDKTPDGYNKAHDTETCGDDGC